MTNQDKGIRSINNSILIEFIGTTVIGFIMLSLGIAVRAVQDINSWQADNPSRGRAMFRQLFIGNQLCLYGAGSLVTGLALSRTNNSKLASGLSITNAGLIGANMLFLVVLLGIWYFNQSDAIFETEKTTKRKVLEGGQTASVLYYRIIWTSGMTRAGIAVLGVGNFIGLTSLFLSIIYNTILLTTTGTSEALIDVRSIGWIGK